jgi:hypothetical protein
MAPETKPCDGTWQDYHRHKRRKEKACAASMAAHREYVRQSRMKEEKGQ